MSVFLISNTTSGQSILNYFKYKVTKLTFESLKLLFHPCCSANLIINSSTCANNGEYQGVIFTGVKISDPLLANQDVTISLNITNYNTKGGFGFISVTLDSKGFWTGDIQTAISGCSFPISPINLEIRASVVPKNLDVYHTSNIVTVSVDGCC